VFATPCGISGTVHALSSKKYPFSRTTAPCCSSARTWPFAASMSAQDRSSPGLNGPTPAGVPVKSKSPSCGRTRTIRGSSRSAEGASAHLERHDGRDVLDEARDVKDHLARRAALLELAVDLEPEVQIVRVGHAVARHKVAVDARVRSALRHGGGSVSGKAHLMGVKVSKPFEADHGRPRFLTAFCMLRAVTSFARAARGSEMCREVGEGGGTRTVACDVAHRVRLGDVSAILADDDAELNCITIRTHRGAGSMKRADLRGAGSRRVALRRSRRWAGSSSSA
jgi:hypothetical protein